MSNGYLQYYNLTEAPFTITPNPRFLYQSAKHREALNHLVFGITERKGGYVLNTGDIGLLASLEKLSAAEASDSSNGGATIAAHAQHLRYGLA